MGNGRQLVLGARLEYVDSAFALFLFFSLILMKKLIVSLLLTPLLLTGCFKTQTLTEADKALPTVVTAFDRSSVSVDYDNSYFAFTGKKGTTKNHQCEFEKYSVDMVLDESDPSDLEKAQVTVSVDISSMKTDSDRLTGHLLGSQFFDVDQYSSARFSSREIRNVGENLFELVGDLEIRGVTQEVTLRAEITNEYAHLTHDLLRTPYGVGEEAVADAVVPLDVKLMFQ